jgi:hypothetical protein
MVAWHSRGAARCHIIAQSLTVDVTARSEIVGMITGNAR